NLAGSGQIQGFSNIAFPIVRRVFGGLVANELVSIQPMSLPSGLIFYLDYTYGSNVGQPAGESGSTYTRGQSLYNNPTGKGVQSGSLATGGMYDLVNTGYSRVTGSALNLSFAAVGAWKGANGDTWTSGGMLASATDFSGSNARFADYDGDVENALASNSLDAAFAVLAINGASFNNMDKLAVNQLAVFQGVAGPGTAWGETYQGGTGVLNLRRLNKRGNWNAGVFTPDALNGTHVLMLVKGANGALVSGSAGAVDVAFSLSSALSVDSGTGATVTIPSFETDFGATPSPVIPEIDIKIEAISITAETRKLRAKWSPELAQDLNAYHSMDAEVELTSILSEQIALEIDREILNDLVSQANGANYYWSRSPGRFVNKVTGARQTLDAGLTQIGPQFTGTVREWYETLIETVIDVANTIHRKTLRGSANFMVTGPDVCTILEASVLYKPKFSLDGEGQVGSPFTIGAEAVGTLSNRFTVYKDPYFARNKILVGYKGGSYLETGYVYAPYVPLIVTPTIFAPEDFTPRKGVMTRYGKKTVRSDFYGTVTVLDMNVI
ncbi:MAG: hypothetical protein EBS90_08560, partial [Betaproteobacteria bacterium]|nr:hypothetical protein [Betaproteobacteria bacterium]